MSTETTIGKYGKIVERDGKTSLHLAPQTWSDQERSRYGCQPVRFEERDRSKRAKGRKPVQRDGYIEVIWIYKED